MNTLIYYDLPILLKCFKISALNHIGQEKGLEVWWGGRGKGWKDATWRDICTCCDHRAYDVQCMLAGIQAMRNPGMIKCNLIRADHVGKKLAFHGALLSKLRTRCSSIHGKFASERSSSGVLEARWSRFLPGQSCSWRKSRTKAHMDLAPLLKS
jgi:hypothetical protein